MKINLTPVQVIAMILVVLGAITGGTAQLTDIVGPGLTKILVAGASLATTMLSGWIMIITGQTSQVRAVSAMPGVEKIVVNEKSSQALATLAVAQEGNKVEPSPSSQAAVAAIAKGP